MRTDELQALFKTPPRKYRMTPMMRVNDEFDEERMGWQLASLKEKGFGGIFLCCEYFNDGAPQKFCSDWWWNVVAVTSRLCAELDLAFWIYDEEDWPSGSIGGQLVERNPDHSWKYLHREETRVEGGGPARIETGKGALVAAVAYQLDGDRLVEDSLTDITPQTRDGVVSWRVPEGAWQVDVFTARRGPGLLIDNYGDLMSREAMGAFVDWVYGGHADHVAKACGTLAGFFTDEPAFSLAMVDFGDRFPWYPAMPYTPELEACFEARHGLSWRRGLPLLYRDTGPEGLRYLYRYWETCLYLYHENYFGQIHRFCEAHGMLASGHLVIEEEFVNHLAQQAGNLLTHFRYMHVPGMDWIHPFEETFRHLPATTPKYPVSMAHLMGRHQTWAETFAASGWGLQPRDIRRIVNWEHVNGISMQVPICYKYSLRGLGRASFYPPGIGYQQPYWDHITPFADYEARLCALAAGDGHRAQVALAYPEVDIWTHCREHDLLRERSKTFNALGDALRFSGYDFDLLDDRAFIEQATMTDGHVATETECFEVVVVPPVDGVRLSVLESWQRLVDSGGSVLFVGVLPRHSFERGTDDPRVAAVLNDLLGEEHARTAPFWRSRTSGGRAGFAPCVEDAVSLLQEAIEPELRWEGDGRFVAYHRWLEDGDLYLIHYCDGVARDSRVGVTAQGAPEYWDPETGTHTPVAVERCEHGRTWITLHFEPYALLPLVFRHNREPGPVPVFRTVEILDVPGPFAFSGEETHRRPGVAWNFAEDGDGYTPSCAPAPDIPEKLPAGDWRDHGLEHFSGIGCYAFEAVIPATTSFERVLLDLGEVCNTVEMTVNGILVARKFFEPYVVDLTEAVRPGVNRFEVRVANTLSNFMAQFPCFEGKALHEGGDFPERRRSGLFGPVRILLQAIEE